MRDPRLLLQFAAVAEVRSFTEAARSLGVAQPWLSTRIRTLEAQLGFALFERSTRKVSLTDQGRKLYEVIEPWAALFKIVEGRMDLLLEAASTRLRIRCPQLGEPDQRQAELIATFAEQNPRISVEIEAGSAEIQLELLRQGRLDLVMTILDVDAREWEWIDLYPVCLAIMMRNDDPASAIKPLTSVALADRRVAMFSRARSEQLFDTIYAPLQAAGARQVTVPELRRSLLRTRRDLVVTTLVPAPADAALRHGVLRREMTDIARLSLKLVRLRGHAVSAQADRLWRLASAARRG